MTYDMQCFLEACLDLYTSLTGKPPKFRPVPTPFLEEGPHEACLLYTSDAADPSSEGGVGKAPCAVGALSPGAVGNCNAGLVWTFFQEWGWNGTELWGLACKRGV